MTATDHTILRAHVLVALRSMFQALRDIDALETCAERILSDDGDSLVGLDDLRRVVTEAAEFPEDLDGLDPDDVLDYILG